MYDARPAKPPKIPASQMIDELAASLEAERITAGELLTSLEGRGIGLLLLILALPICIPNIPGISTIFGLLMIGPAIQMLLGHKALWMPKFMKRWSFKGDSLRGALRACAVLMRKVEYLARPRWTFLTRWPLTSLVGLQTLIMALILLLPMPGANVIPGVAVALSGLAILQRDGVFMLCSAPVAIGAMAWVYYGGKYVIDFFWWAYEAGQSLFLSLL